MAVSLCLSSIAAGADEQTAAALAHDRFGIALGNLRYAGTALKAVALAATPGDPAYLPTRDNLIAQRYPLTRTVQAYFDRIPGRSVDPRVAEFLDYAVGPEGQADILQAGDFLPLSAAAAAQAAAGLR